MTLNCSFFPFLRSARRATTRSFQLHFNFLSPSLLVPLLSSLFYYVARKLLHFVPSIIATDRWRLFAVVAPLCVYSTNQNTWLDQRVTIVTLKPHSTSIERYDKSVFSRAEIFFFFCFFIIPITNSYLPSVPTYFRRIFISRIEYRQL